MNSKNRTAAQCIFFKKISIFFKNAPIFFVYCWYAICTFALAQLHKKIIILPNLFVTLERNIFYCEIAKSCDCKIGKLKIMKNEIVDFEIAFPQ